MIPRAIEGVLVSCSVRLSSIRAAAGAVPNLVNAIDPCISQQILIFASGVFQIDLGW